jgi:hypothetical protein
MARLNDLGESSAMRGLRIFLGVSSGYPVIRPQSPVYHAASLFPQGGRFGDFASQGILARPSAVSIGIRHIRPSHRIAVVKKPTNC